ncbi:hypothetical protein CE91St41_30310 [Oscillospiraceae bacterium]|nr:hypothetical protein CE91St40_30310 [Oscillospiraceae bacterium]BDF76142.1 hypothetical protein CE91St41_30310 [Oscillospiraceae bacterium]
MGFTYEIVILGAAAETAAFFLEAVARAAALRGLEALAGPGEAQGRTLLLHEPGDICRPAGAARLAVAVGPVAARACPARLGPEGAYLLCVATQAELPLLLDAQQALEASGHKGKVLPPAPCGAAAPFLLGGAMSALRAADLFAVEELAEAVARCDAHNAARNLELLEQGLCAPGAHRCRAGRD